MKDFLKLSLQKLNIVCLLALTMLHFSNGSFRAVLNLRKKSQMIQHILVIIPIMTNIMLKMMFLNYLLSYVMKIGISLTSMIQRVTLYNSLRKNTMTIESFSEVRVIVLSEEIILLQIDTAESHLQEKSILQVFVQCYFTSNFQSKKSSLRYNWIFYFIYYFF